MNQRTKLTLAVSVGTIAIELTLLAALWCVFAKALPLIKTFDQQMIQGVDEQSLLIALGLAWLVFLFMAYHKGFGLSPFAYVLGLGPSFSRERVRV